MSGTNLFNRILYRIWQFKQVLLPKYSKKQWNDAVKTMPLDCHFHLNRLRRSEKAHVLRVYNAILEDKNISQFEKKTLLKLALLHDIGKGVTRHTIIFKVAKVLFPVKNTAHCIAGAKLLKKLGFEKKIVRMVLRHHEKNPTNDLLKRFQTFDDRL
ncbi:MAG: HD domain-containing protein [Candidatus Rifleibacteriota bacterium]